jgi:hypothetical protein
MTTGAIESRLRYAATVVTIHDILLFVSRGRGDIPKIPPSRY